ncbi:hypothetical protein BDZ45DRAFT_318467 [Acephala macrosclerotiorum]|nr:hypothetical protein BDZ45DRAFT_318467 [Acephala macrosclerotiorum]
MHHALDRLGGEVLLDRLVSDPNCFEDFCDGIQVLIKEGFEHEDDQNPSAFTPLYMFEPDIQWDHVPNITLIGDAAHVMTHFSGDGIDLAMKDALELSEELMAEKEKPEPDYDMTLVRFEERMFKRIPDNGKKAIEAMLALFVENTPDTFADFMRGLNASAEGTSDAGAAAT